MSAMIKYFPAWAFKHRAVGAINVWKGSFGMQLSLYAHLDKLSKDLLPGCDTMHYKVTFDGIALP
jgi:hypothetical protein